MLPAPLSRMVAPYTMAKPPRPGIGTEDNIPVTNPLERVSKEVKRRADVVGKGGLGKLNRGVEWIVRATSA